MLNAETPKNNPSNPPTMDRKSVDVYRANRFIAIALDFLKWSTKCDIFALKSKQEPKPLFIERN